MCVRVCVCVCVRAQEVDDLDVRIICWKLTHNYAHDILNNRAAVLTSFPLRTVQLKFYSGSSSFRLNQFLERIILVSVCF